MRKLISVVSLIIGLSLVLAACGTPAATLLTPNIPTILAKTISATEMNRFIPVPFLHWGTIFPP